MKKSSSVKAAVAALFLILFGLIFIIIAFNAHAHYQEFEEKGIKVIATITHIDLVPSPGGRGSYDYHAYVSYEIDGQQFEDILLKTYDESMYVGKEITVYYMPDDKTNIDYVEKSWLFPLAFGSAGVIVFLFGVSTLISKIIKIKEMSKQN